MHIHEANYQERGLPNRWPNPLLITKLRKRASFPVILLDDKGL